MSSNHIFLLLASLLFGALAGLAAFYAVRTNAAKKQEWRALLARLVDVDRAGLDLVALDAFETSGARRFDDAARTLDAEKIWVLLGGIEGLKGLSINSEVLVDMAAYLQRNHPESAADAEALRLQAKEFRFHAERLTLAAKQGSLEFHIHTYAQNAAIAYHLMERHIEVLCQNANRRGFPSLV